MGPSQAVRTGGPAGVALAKYSARYWPVGQPNVVVKGTPLEIGLSGLTTRTLAVPALAMSAAAMLAVRLVLLTNVVGRALLFHCTVEPATKLAPSTVSVNAGPCARVCRGVIPSSAGAVEAVLPSRTMRPTD